MVKQRRSYGAELMMEALRLLETSNCYAWRSRPASAGEMANRELKATIRAEPVDGDGLSLPGELAAVDPRAGGGIGTAVAGTAIPVEGDDR
jgi:hypothetical protein